MGTALKLSWGNLELRVALECKEQNRLHAPFSDSVPPEYICDFVVNLFPAF